MTEQPDDTPRTAQLDRRRFLALGGGLGALGTLASTLGPSVWDRLFADAASAGGATAPHGDRVLVLVTLYGGNDGLNTVVPYGDPAYATARGSLALDPSTVLPLGEGFGLHPALTATKALWDGGRLAVVHGVGFADPDYSHFESMDIWQSGVPEDPVTTGWLGRWLDATRADPLSALAVGPTVPMMLVGQRVQGVAVAPGPLVLPGSSRQEAIFSALARARGGLPPLLEEAAAANAELLVVARRLGPILGRASEAPGGSAGQEGSLAIADGGGGRSGPETLEAQLSVVANLVLARAAPLVYSVELGGFDTHADQAPTQKALLGQLDAALGSFLEAVAPGPASAGREVVVVVYTEFGRRVAANASAGTDHGWANVVLVAGAGVKGGFYGEPPDLSRLVEGNLAYTTDFRRLYATLFEEVLGVEGRPFLGGSFPILPLL